MSKIDDGGAAFPFAATDQSNVERQTNGMTLRDWFAGQMLPKINSGWPNVENRDLLAKQAYQMADAMIEARKQ